MKRRWMTAAIVSLACISFLLAVGCGPTAPYDPHNLGRLQGEALSQKHRDMLQDGFACLRTRCEGESELKSRNQIKSLKCHTLALTLQHYEGRCRGGAPEPTPGTDREATRLGFDCIIGANDVALLYDTMSILRCL